MEFATIRPSALGESFVLIFQFVGLAGLLLSRLLPTTPWARHGKRIFVLGLIGLGAAGALCGSQQSGFSLMAGGTMTSLLVGMNLGTHATVPGRADGTEGRFAG
jgi:hypothetical protein